MLSLTLDNGILELTGGTADLKEFVVR
jgi:hypothetical protein